MRVVPARRGGDYAPAMERAIAKRSPWRRRALVAALVVLVVLAIGAAWTAWLVRAAERRFPPRGSFVEADGLRVHAIERGPRDATPPIVLIHGAFGTADDWDATVLDALARTHRVLAFDRPGHGWSEASTRCDGNPREQARVLVHAWKARGVERPLVVGFSYGAAVALAAAIAAPEDVGGLVTINGAMHSWGGTPEPAYDLAELPIVGRVFTHTWATPLARMLAPKSVERAFAPNAPPESFGRSPIALAIRPRSFEANARDVNHLDAFLRDEERSYASLALPLVVVVGERDQVTTPELHSHALAREVKDAELVSIPDAGHQIPYTHGAELVRAIEQASARMSR